MKRLLLFSFLFFPVSVSASDLQYRKTVCNARYNNLGIVSENVNCDAWFDSNQRLNRVKWYYPKTKKWYDFGIGSPAITMDPRWKECIRYTFSEGNQWQICTAPDPNQLKIKSY
jgi:hypothetical protein